MSEFEEELKGQPEALKRTFNYYLSPEGQNHFNNARNSFLTHKFSRVIYTGMGSSNFSSLIPFYYLNSAGIVCNVWDAGEFLNYFPKIQINSPTELTIAVSQSGESGEIVQLFNPKYDFSTKLDHLWAITNNIESTLGRTAKYTFPTIAGTERSVTSKTYVTALLLQYLVARMITGQNYLPDKLRSNILQILSVVKNGFSESTNNFFSEADAINDFLGDYSFLQFVGQGTSMATVNQACLNIKEVSKIYSEGLTLGMFHHGPIEVIDSQFRSIFLVNDKKAANNANPIINNVTNKWGKGKVLLISNQPDLHKHILNERIKLIENPIKNSYLAPIFEICLLQPYLCLKAKKNGFIPGEFRNSQKITK